MKKLLLILGALLCLTSQAQTTLQGTVANVNKEKLEYATVRLLRQDSTFVAGTVTDTLGIYKFKVEAGNYLLMFTTIGYKTAIYPVSIASQRIDFPLVTLEGDNVVLGEIVVKGNSFIRQKDRILVVPDRQQVKHAHTGYDLLYNLMIPGIDVNKRTGEVNTLGGTVTLYINGEKADFRDVQALRPGDIENVEYYDIPTGKYANDVAAVNYITKRYKTGGYTAIDGKQTIGYLAGDYNVSAKMNHNNTTYSFWGGYNMKDYDGIKQENHETIHFTDYDINRDGLTESATNRSNQQYMQFKVGKLTNTNNLSAQVALIHNRTPQNTSYGKLDYWGRYTRSENSAERKESDNLQPSVNLYGSFNLPKNQKLEFTLKGTYSQNDYARTYSENDRTSFTDVNENMYAFDVSGRYDVKLKHKNTFGVYGYHFHRITSSSYQGDYQSWQHLWSGETLFLLNYTQGIGNNVHFSFSPGFSMMDYKLHEEDLQKEYSFRMKTNLVYQMNRQHQLVLAVNVGNNTPRIDYLNTMDQTVDFLQIRRGNPNLDNTKLYEGDLVYGGQFGRLNLQAIAVYEFSQNAVYADYYIENEKLVGSYRSDANVHAFMFQTNAAYRFSDHLRAKLSGGYLHMSLPDLSHLTGNCFFGSLDFNYYWKDFAANLYANGTTSRLNKSLVFAQTPIIYGLSVNWSKKGWYVEAGTENPFTSHSHYKAHADYGVYQYRQIQSSRIYQQTGYVKVAYTFDFGKKTSRESKNINTNINSAILKGE